MPLLINVAEFSEDSNNHNISIRALNLDDLEEIRAMCIRAVEENYIVLPETPEQAKERPALWPLAILNLNTAVWVTLSYITKLELILL